MLKIFMTTCVIKPGVGVCWLVSGGAPGGSYVVVTNRLTLRELPPIWKKSAATLIFSCPSTSCHTFWIFSSSRLLGGSYSSSAPALAADCQLGVKCLSVLSFLRSTYMHANSLNQQG